MAKCISKGSGKEVLVWESSDELTPEVQFLLERKGLKLNYENPLKFFESEFSTASSFSVLIIHDILYKDNNQIADADFSLVSSAEFVVNYQCCN